MNKTLKNFRLLAFVEGISLLALLFIAMPLKYYAGNTEIVPVVGMIHGVLFMAFMTFSLKISHQLNWPVQLWLLVLLSSMLPAGTFFLNLKLKKIQIED